MWILDMLVEPRAEVEELEEKVDSEYLSRLTVSN